MIHEDKTLSLGSLTVEQSLSVDRSNHFRDPREILNTYVAEGSRPSVGVFGSEAAFSPEDSVDFMCANTGNFILSTKGVELGKLSNDDRMRLTAFHTWTLFQAREQMKDLESCLIIQKDMNTYNQIKLEDACMENNRKFEATEASVEDLKKAASNGDKAVEYKLKVKQAQEMIHHLKKELLNSAIDRWLKSE
ncbi:hypothetical protein ACOSP7_032417 [Xanthoceras sorbifolium]